MSYFFGPPRTPSEKKALRLRVAEVLRQRKEEKERRGGAAFNNSYNLGSGKKEFSIKRPWSGKDEDRAWVNSPSLPDVDIQLARYGKTIEFVEFGDSALEIARKEEIGTILIALPKIQNAPTVEQWSEDVRDCYPDIPLPQPDETGKVERDRASRRAAARYEFVGEAVMRLLVLADAPPSIIDDFKHEWRMPRVNRSDPRADAQKAYNENPTLSLTQAEVASGYDRANISRAIKYRIIRKG